MESFSCPFCSFSNQDSYFLLQHVELIHPENGESPFIATDLVEDEGRSSSSRHQNHEESATRQHKQPLPSSLRSLEDEGRSSSSSHQNHEEEAARRHKEPLPSSSSTLHSSATYVECPYNCGELVDSAELTSHTDFHLAENMAFEEEALGPVQFSTGACNDKQAVKDISTHFSTDIPKALRRDDSLLQPTPRRSSLREMLFGGPPRRTPTKVSGGGTKRLGVGSTLCANTCQLLTTKPNSERSLALMRMNSRCPHGCDAC
jgi:hypothetical protein